MDGLFVASPGLANAVFIGLGLFVALIFIIVFEPVRLVFLKILVIVASLVMGFFMLTSMISWYEILSQGWTYYITEGLGAPDGTIFNTVLTYIVPILFPLLILSIVLFAIFKLLAIIFKIDSHDSVFASVFLFILSGVGMLLIVLSIVGLLVLSFIPIASSSKRSYW